MNTPVEVTLTTGIVVKCRQVPPYVLGVVHQAVPEPVFPKIVEKSIAGGEEEQPALPGTDEFDEYQKKVRQYRREVGLLSMEFHLNYGIVAWSFPDEDEFHVEPPIEWEPDKMWLRYGGTAPRDEAHRRYLYLSMEIVLNEGDSDRVDEGVGKNKTSDEMSVTQEEVKAATSPFESEMDDSVQ